MATLAERLWRRIARGNPDECWDWLGTVRNNGYGKIKVHGRYRSTHRVAFEIAKGPIPKGLLILHSCDRRRCCNPNHLRAGTAADNAKDRMERSVHKERNIRAGGVAQIADDIVKEVQRRLKAGETYRAIEAVIGVSRTTIGRIKRGESRFHLMEAV